MNSAIRQAVYRTAIAGLLALLGGFATGAYAAVSPQGAYVRDNAGNVVRDNQGHCVRTREWSPQTALRECDAELFAAFEQPQQPPMQRITLEADTRFDFDKAELSAQDKQQLDQLVQSARGAEKIKIHVNGYTDRIGTEAYNKDLSRRRADAVRAYLIDRGVPKDAITISARGEQDPVVSCEGLRGDALISCLRPNRRSEIDFAGFEVKQQQNNQPTQPEE